MISCIIVILVLNYQYLSSVQVLRNLEERIAECVYWKEQYH